MNVLLWTGVVAIGGFGSVLRFLVDRSAAQRLATSFPFGTLTVNVTGSFLLGLVNGVTALPDVLLLAGVAAVGSYTTFSTWMLDTVAAASRGLLALAALNVGLSLALGLAAAALGRALGAVL